MFFTWRYLFQAPKAAPAVISSCLLSPQQSCGVGLAECVTGSVYYSRLSWQDSNLELSRSSADTVIPELYWLFYSHPIHAMKIDSSAAHFYA